MKGGQQTAHKVEHELGKVAELSVDLVAEDARRQGRPAHKEWVASDEYLKKTILLEAQAMYACPQVGERTDQEAFYLHRAASDMRYFRFQMQVGFWSLCT